MRPAGPPVAQAHALSRARSAPGATPGACAGRADAAGVTDFFAVEGEEVHEVAVGPVHAGVIEPGHFRFQCHGETGAAPGDLAGLPAPGRRARAGRRTRRRAPSTTPRPGRRHHRSATPRPTARRSRRWPGCRVPARGAGAARHRAGARAAGQSHRRSRRAGRRRRLPADRVLLRPAARRLPQPDRPALRQPLRPRPGAAGRRAASTSTTRDRRQLRERGSTRRCATSPPRSSCCGNASVMARFEDTGRLSARSLPRAGPGRPGGPRLRPGARRARRFPSGIYRFAQIPVVDLDTGDVFARACVRWLEIQRSAAFLRDSLTRCRPDPCRAAAPRFARTGCVVVAGRGLARRDLPRRQHRRATGRFAHYKVVDPSLPQLDGLAMALRDQQISDFPLCNKSFNLSYCGHDL